jgi:hypothetical protein
MGSILFIIMFVFFSGNWQGNNGDFNPTKEEYKIFSLILDQLSDGSFRY